MLTKEQKANYVSACGQRCPFCESKDVEGDGYVEVDGCSAWQLCSCNSCEKQWRDIYSLADIEDTE